MVALCSCELFAKDETVEFELPQWPEYLPELEGWKVQGVRVGPDKTHISLRLPKNQPCCIIATPVTQNQFFKPAGTIYPYSQKITWSGGYAAHLFTINPDSGQFNWEKCLETLEQKQESSYNPWLLDSQEILEGIEYQDFTATKLRLTGTLQIPLDFVVYSSYVPENQAADQENCVVTVKKGIPELFVLRQSSGSAGFEVGIIISAASAKNISLDLISMPIIKEGL